MTAHDSLGRVYLLILLTTLFWGGTPVAGKLVIQEIPPLTAGVLRYGFAALLLAATFWRRLPSPRSLSSRDLWMLLWVGILGTFLNHVLFFMALVFAPATHGAIIAPTTSPIWTMLLAVVGVLVCQGPEARATLLRFARAAESRTPPRSEKSDPTTRG